MVQRYLGGGTFNSSAFHHFFPFRFLPCDPKTVTRGTVAHDGKDREQSNSPIKDDDSDIKRSPGLRRENKNPETSENVRKGVSPC